MKLIASILLAVAAFAASEPTFRASVTPRSFFEQYGLPIAPGNGDRLDVTITSTESDLYRVTVITKAGRVIRQLVERPTMRPAACERPEPGGLCATYPPMASFMVEGVDRVIVEALIAGPPASGQPTQ